MKKNLPCGWVLMVMDFGKNRDVRHQDECKSAFFSTSQITVHPIVMFYRSKEVPELIVRDSVVFLTDDNTHDHHAVDHFFNKAVTYLHDSVGIQFTQLIIYSDGCSGQYKSKGPFADLSLKEFAVQRNYFGSDHGKSECDGELGSINRSTDMAILGRKAIITNASDMHLWCKDNLTIHDPGFRRSFILVQVGDINRHRLETDVKSVPGTRKLHQVANVGTPYKIKGRDLSCYCQSCRSGGQQEDCLNSDYVKPYINISLKPCKVNNKSTATTSKEPATIKLDNEIRRDFFFSLLAEFAAAKTFSDLKKMVESALPVMAQFPLRQSIVNITDCKLIVDGVAAKLIPPDLPDRLTRQLPVTNSGIGNCLPSAASQLVFGNEDHTQEMRVRMIIEQVTNQASYLDARHLAKGVENKKEADQILRTYAMMYGSATMPIDDTVARQIFEEDVVGARKDRSFMGMWQVHALASVMNCVLMSVYPWLGERSVIRSVMHRPVYPVEVSSASNSTSASNSDILGLMWSSTRVDMQPQNWVPNHFVALIPVNTDDLDPFVEVEDGDDMELPNDCSFNFSDLDLFERYVLIHVHEYSLIHSPQDDE